jgi:GNAT superfamily N-acetyltransferase
MLAESRQQGFKFVDTLVDDYATGKNRFQQPGEALFALFDGAQLIAIGGLNRDPYGDDPRVGRIRHVYVLAAYRGQGLGKRLMERLIAEAHPYFRRLTLRTFTEDADRFYRALGFQTEPAIEHATHRLELDKSAQ